MGSTIETQSALLCYLPWFLMPSTRLSSPAVFYPGSPTLEIPVVDKQKGKMQGEKNCYKKRCIMLLNWLCTIGTHGCAACCNAPVKLTMRNGAQLPPDTAADTQTLYGCALMRFIAVHQFSLFLICFVPSSQIRPNPFDSWIYFFITFYRSTFSTSPTPSMVTHLLFLFDTTFV